ncbi:MAG: Gfo/Idh/MocA family oxidoreductase, partial [Defluviitaleaceae bacterium]|nr:Gfo/Idh/MocA family oxidoreductase [Defluviitaleaceae bacterium]
KAAILGAGFMGGLHSKNLAGMQDVSICAVCDIDEAAAKKLAAAHGAEPYTSLEKMLDEKKIDAVYICIPPYGHNGEFEKIASHKKHIFIEKPIHLHFCKAKKMIEAAEKNKIFSQVGYQYRFGSAVKELKKRIDNGSAGKPVLFTATYQCNSLHAPWWRDKNTCGSQILEQVIHTYDLAMYLFGSPEKISAYMSNICHTKDENYTIEDVSASIVKFKNGAIGSVGASNCAIPMRWDNLFTVVYENLTAQFLNANEAVFTNTAGRIAGEVINHKTEIDMYLDEDKYFIATLRGECENISTIKDGYDSLQFVDAVARSAESGGAPVSL